MILPPGDTAQCLGMSVIVMTGGSWHPDVCTCARTHTHTHSLPLLGSIQPSLQPSYHLQEITAIRPTLQLGRLRSIGLETSKAARSLLAALKATLKLEPGAREGEVRRVEVLVSSFQITGSEPHSLTEAVLPASPRALGV